jgi:hypothetical protein
MAQFNPYEEGSLCIPDVQATLTARAHEVKVVPRGASYDDGVLFRMKPDRRRASATVLPYKERRAVRL